MEDQLYREIILEHWQNPHHRGVIQEADFDLEKSNPACGDRLRISGRIAGRTITEIGFEGSGCAISIAGASLLSDFVHQKKVSDVIDLDDEALLEQLGLHVTPARTRCALLSFAALKQAIS